MREGIEDFKKINLIISDELYEKLEERLILLEDIKRVIYNAEKIGVKIYDPGKDCFIAHYRPNIITYWVEYKKEKDSYIVINAYSHRLTIMDE